MMNLRTLQNVIVVSLLFLSVSADSAHTATAAEPPNIVFILADDMGYSDAGCYGSEIRTPNLDALAASGLRFTQFYNTARCWPTRAALLTGYYPQQIHRDALPELPGGSQQRRQTWARLLPDLLRPAGYHSYHSGKWHVDGDVLAGGFERSLNVRNDGNFSQPKAICWTTSQSSRLRMSVAITRPSQPWITPSTACSSISDRLQAPHSSSTSPSLLHTSHYMLCRKTLKDIVIGTSQAGTSCGGNGISVSRQPGS